MSIDKICPECEGEMVFHKRGRFKWMECKECKVRCFMFKWMGNKWARFYE